MTNLTLTINLDSLTATQLAALHIIALTGTGNDGRIDHRAIRAIRAAGEANCGNEYTVELEQARDFLNDKEEA